MAPVRTMQFSILGSGPLTLFAAEAMDHVHIIDVATTQNVQTLDFFGEVGGLAVSKDGSELMVANGDKMLGGLTVYERFTPRSNQRYNDRIVDDWEDDYIFHGNDTPSWRNFDIYPSLDFT